MPWSYPKYRSCSRSQQQAFEDSACSGASDGQPDRQRRRSGALRGELIDAHYLSVLGVTPHSDRDFGRDEDRAPGVAPIVLISHALWQRRFGGDPGVIGRTIRSQCDTAHRRRRPAAGFRGMTGEAQVFVPLMTIVQSRCSGS